MFSICEIPPSPWQPIHSPAFSLPAATSAAWAGRHASVENPKARPHNARNTNRLGMIGFPFALKREAAAARSRAAAALVIEVLLLVADAIDRTGPVVSDEDRTVLVQDDIGRAAEIALVAFEPAGREHLLLGIPAVGPDGDTHDTGTLIFMPIPRAVFGDQDAVLVLGGKLAAGVELHAERSHMRTEIEHGRREFRTFVTHRELRIRQVALVAIRVAEVLA